MLPGTTGRTSCPGMRGSVVTSTNTTAADGMPSGAHLALGRTSLCPVHGAHKTHVVPEDPRASGPQGTPPHQPVRRTQAQNPVPSRTTTRPTSACPTTWVGARSSTRSHRRALSSHLPQLGGVRRL